MNYAQAKRLFDATPDHLSDEQRLEHMEGVLRMIADPPGAIVERPCFLCGVVQILMAGHKCCLDCHNDELCRICKGDDYRSPYRARISTAAVQAQGVSGRRRYKRGASGKPGDRQ